MRVDAALAWTPCGALIPAAAAWRAGIRPSRAETVALPTDDERPVAAFLAPAAGGTEGTARLIRLLELAFEAGPRPGRDEPVFLVSGRPTLGLSSAETALAAIASRCGGRVAPTWGGRPETIAALAEAERLLARRAASAAWVVAVDTSYDLDRLTEAEARGALKGPEQPAGFMPGEAAVALRFSGGGAARPPLGDVLAVGGTHSTPLGHLLRAALGRVSSGHLHADLDGGEPRARAWGQALATVGAGPLAPFRTWIPAVSFGEVGAAAPLLSLALALARRLPGDTIVSALDDAGLGAVYQVLRAPSPAGGGH